MPSICTASRSSPDRSRAIQADIRSADSATKRRKAADLDTPAPGPAGTSPSGRRTARPKRRVVTPINIGFIAQRPSQSSAFARSQLGSATSLPPPRPRTRGRCGATLPPWKPIGPTVRPQRCARRPPPRP
jgi:hypothetical protein